MNRLVATACLLCALAPSVASADAALRLAPGDVLAVRVARLPELDRDAMIGPDGALRLGGLAIPVAGRDLDGAHEAITQALADRLGAAPPFVMVDVAEWRPVTVYGAGTRGGDVAWRPDMTVRRALASVDGRPRGEDQPPLQEILEAQRARTRILDETDRLARALVRIAILEAELGLEPQQMTDAEPAPAVLDRFRRIETQMHMLRRDRLAQQRDNLQSQRDLAIRQLGSMDEELQLQRRRVGIFEEQVTVSEALSARGLATQDRASNRQTDLMGAQLVVVRLLSDRADAETQQILIDSLITELQTNWTLELTRDLSEARSTASAARNALDLAHRDLAASEEAVGTGALEPGARRYAIHRTTEGGTALIAAEADTVVLPGDVIEVSRQ
ncbi:MAG: polysaccharide biosynthesis/export family protein [Paracoccus hibiscisoli]|uniref:polysaccharide biosynthesis/export family protein n=1 Tax=Paracoccus hibiscisoli TaxID=2023261 RepID=UPI003919EF5F